MTSIEALMALKVTIFVSQSLRFETLWCFSETPNIWRYLLLTLFSFQGTHFLAFTVCRDDSLFMLTQLIHHVNIFFLETFVIAHYGDLTILPWRSLLCQCKFMENHSTLLCYC